MRFTKITLQKLSKINPKSILYAEFAESGAMGYPGTARIFTLEADTPKYYLIDNIFDDQSNERIYVAIHIYLDELAQKGILTHTYAGFGNHAYKPPKITFARDDDHASFVYTNADNQSFRIPASCNGVYGHVVATFAARKVSIKQIEDYLQKSWSHFSSDEYSLYQQYLIQIKRNDAGQGWFDFTPIDYYDSIKYLRHLSGENYLLNEQYLHDGQNALNKYRLKYIVDKIGWNKLDDIITHLIKTKSTKLFPAIQESLGQSVYSIYDKIETIKSDRTSTECLDPNNLENLFDHPVLVNFSKPAHHTIIKNIIDRTGNSFNPDARSISLYLANYLLNEETLSLSDILPAVIHIIEVMPDDDFNSTHTDDLFYLCGEIIDHAWRYLEEDKEKQKKYRDLVYNVYWQRVGSFWPILNRQRFEFKHQSANKIFDDSVSFILSLEDIAKRNREIKLFLDNCASRINYQDGPLGRRAFVYTLQGLEPEQEFEKILQTIQPQDYFSYLSYPSTIKEAKILLTELFRTDPDARITNTNRLAVFESLTITPNTINVGEFILGYIDEHFDDFVAIIVNDIASIEQTNLNEVLTDLFIAMSQGITEENEFPALKSIRNKMLDLGCNPIKLTAALDYARRHRRMILFQRSALQKYF